MPGGVQCDRVHVRRLTIHQMLPVELMTSLVSLRRSSSICCSLGISRWWELRSGFRVVAMTGRWGKPGFVFAAGDSMRTFAMENAVTPAGLSAVIHGQCRRNWATEIQDSMERPTENMFVDKMPFIDGHVSRVLVWSRYSGDAPAQF